jgi:hypothetical protein
MVIAQVGGFRAVAKILLAARYDSSDCMGRVRMGRLQN